MQELLKNEKQTPDASHGDSGEPSGKTTAMRFLCAVAAFSSFLATISYVIENYALAELQAGYAGVMLAGALIVRLAVRS